MPELDQETRVDKISKSLGAPKRVGKEIVERTPEGFFKSAAGDNPLSSSPADPKAVIFIEKVHVIQEDPQTNRRWRVSNKALIEEILIEPLAQLGWSSTQHNVDAHIRESWAAALQEEAQLYYYAGHGETRDRQFGFAFRTASGKVRANADFIREHSNLIKLEGSLICIWSCWSLANHSMKDVFFDLGASAYVPKFRPN